MSREIEYPSLLKSKLYDFMVLFSAEQTGMVVMSTDERHQINMMSKEWTPANNEDVWVVPDSKYMQRYIDQNREDEEEEMFTVTETNDTITGANDGKKNSFYDFPEWVTNIDTLAEYLQLDGYDFNVLKTLTVNLGARHAGTNVERELNKRLHYSEMAINKFKR